MKRVLIAILLGLFALISLAVLLSTLVVFSPSFSLFRNQIAVIPVKGSIESEKLEFVAELSASEVSQRLMEAKQNPSIAAVLLDIDSPGGSIVATKQIVAAVQDVREEKKVVAWIGDIGTSGAYYVAAACDYIIADEDSLTGSIGVISVVANVQKLLQDWGVEVQVLREGKHKGMGNIFEDLNAEQAALLQEILGNAFEHFKRDVKQFREGRLDLAEFNEKADGRVLSGEQALAIGLIDELGTKQDAVNKAAELAGVEQPTTVDFGQKEISLFELFAGSGYRFGLGLRQGFFEETMPAIKS